MFNARRSGRRAAAAVPWPLASRRRSAVAAATRAAEIAPGRGAAAEPAALAAPRREDATWAATLERIAQSVVAIEIDSTRAFDTEWNTSSQATGFVVDAERGLILTNRHVVTPGPVTAEATFLNREEVQLYPVYRDPVHDFGLYRYDPSKLRFIKPRSLPLHPEGAQIGREIRVIGNNAGEQLSILAGTHRAPRPRGAGLRRSAATTTSTPSTCRPRPAPRAVRRARRWSTSRAA